MLLAPRLLQVRTRLPLIPGRLILGRLIAYQQSDRVAPDGCPMIKEWN